MEIAESQKKVYELLKEVRHPRVGAMISLSEEVGELAKEVLDKEFYEKTKDDQNLESEMADVFVSLLEMANVYGIRLDEALSKRLDELKPRVKEWEKTSETLGRKRKQMD